MVTTLISGAISISMGAVASRANLMKPAAVDNFDAELVDAVAELPVGHVGRRIWRRTEAVDVQSPGQVTAEDNPGTT